MHANTTTFRQSFPNAISKAYTKYSSLHAVRNSVSTSNLIQNMISGCLLTSERRRTGTNTGRNQEEYTCKSSLNYGHEWMVSFPLTQHPSLWLCGTQMADILFLWNSSLLWLRCSYMPSPCCTSIMGIFYSLQGVLASATSWLWFARSAPNSIDLAVSTPFIIGLPCLLIDANSCLNMSAFDSSIGTRML